MSNWTFLTNHAHVLLCIARDPGLRLRDIADVVGITERAAQHIVNELVDDGYVSRARVGNRNTYEIHPELPFRIAMMRHREIGGLLALLGNGLNLYPSRPRAAQEPAETPDRLA